MRIQFKTKETIFGPMPSGSDFGKPTPWLWDTGVTEKLGNGSDNCYCLANMLSCEYHGSP